MAGSWSALSFRDGLLNNAYTRPIGLVKTFTADASDGSIPANEIVPNVSGLCTGVEVEFGSPAPNSLTVVMKTIGGITFATGTGMTASGVIPVSPPFDVCGGYQILCTGNTENGAIGSIIPKFR